MQMPMMPASGPNPTQTSTKSTQMMEGMARRNVMAAESNVESHRKGVRFLARNTASTIPPSMLYTVERMATATDSKREVKQVQCPIPAGIFGADPSPAVPQQIFLPGFPLAASGGQHLGRSSCSDAVHQASTFFLRKLVSISTKMTMAAMSKITPMAE